MFGVAISPPKAPASEKPMSSATIRRMFGLRMLSSRTAVSDVAPQAANTTTATTSHVAVSRFVISLSPGCIHATVIFSVRT